MKEKIPIPPLHLQREVSAFFNEEQGVRREIETEIKLIREYRDRLITDAVTGQVDVRGWKPGTDDVVSNEELSALGNGEADTGEEEEVDSDD
jgi:type I restriction enzyme S subunit